MPNCEGVPHSPKNAGYERDDKESLDEQKNFQSVMPNYMGGLVECDDYTKQLIQQMNGEFSSIFFEVICSK